MKGSMENLLLLQLEQPGLLDLFFNDKLNDNVRTGFMCLLNSVMKYTVVHLFTAINVQLMNSPGNCSLLLSAVQDAGSSPPCQGQLGMVNTY